jgi:hypothetical protein
MELKHINGRNIINLLDKVEIHLRWILNSKDEEIEDLKDETCYYTFEYEEEYIENNRFVLDFTIDSDYVIRGNSIYIQADGSVECVLNEPFDSGSQYNEIEDILNFV